jgi:geranylgeranyl diphosphate synthase type I
MRETIVASGAVDAVERDIERLVAQGLERLHDTRALLDDGRQVLVDLATYATSRTT